jgi:hypothetical protein
MALPNLDLTSREIGIQLRRTWHEQRQLENRELCPTGMPNVSSYQQFHKQSPEA